MAVPNGERKTADWKDDRGAANWNSGRTAADWNGDRKVADMKQALSEAALPRGFRFAATACGLKKTGALDLAVFSSDVPASAAAVFTQNLVVAAPVLICKKHLRASKGRMSAVVVNAGNANCATGAAGHAAAERTVAEAARRLGVSSRTVATLVARKELPSLRIGRRRVITIHALKQFLDRDHATSCMKKVRKEAVSAT